MKRVIEQGDSFMVEGIKKGFFDKSEYMIFRLVEQKPKTSVWRVSNKKSGGLLGKIEWYPHWRQYVFYPAMTLYIMAGA